MLKQKISKKKPKILTHNAYVGSMASSSAITLVALVITIIILLILAGVTLSFVIGDNGLIKRAKDAEKTTELATLKEQLQLSALAAYDESIGKIVLGNIETPQGLEYVKDGLYRAADGTEFKVNPDGTVEILSNEKTDDNNSENSASLELEVVDDTIKFNLNFTSNTDALDYSDTNHFRLMGTTLDAWLIQEHYTGYENIDAVLADSEYSNREDLILSHINLSNLTNTAIAFEIFLGNGSITITKNSEPLITISKQDINDEFSVENNDLKFYFDGETALYCTLKTSGEYEFKIDSSAGIFTKTYTK